ncbi:MAG: META domain-containing protein [Anaerolineae bacterium]|nr:META domain-containing protein [Anaerolineae bacterium]
MKNRTVIFFVGMVLTIVMLTPVVSAQTGTVTPTATAQGLPTSAAPETAAIGPTAVMTETATIKPTAAVTLTATPVPMLPGGLRLDDVTFNSYDLGKEIEGIVVSAAPYDNSEPPGPVGAPAHLAYEFDGITRLKVIPVEDYQAQWNAAGDNTISQSLAQLRALLRDKPASPRLPLPFLPPVPATNDVAGRVRYLDFNGGSGIAYLGRWSQDASPVLASQILYSFLGLTNDGKYIVSFQYPASTSFLPDDISDLLPEHLAYIEANPKTYLQQTSSLLNVLPNSAYGPDLSRLDGLVFSITVPSEGTLSPGPTEALPTPEGTQTAPAPAETADGGQVPPASTPIAAAAEDYRLLLSADWRWLETAAPTETLAVPDPSLYTIRFNNANGFGITADCNIGAGNYSISGNTLTIKNIQATLVYCGDESLDQTFTAQLLQAANYSFEGDTLLIQLGNDGGTMKFGQ